MIIFTNMLLYTLIGAAAGAGVGIALYLLSIFGIGLLNCFFEIITFGCIDDMFSDVISKEFFVNTGIFLAICGAIIGLVYGIHIGKEKQRIADFNEAERIATLAEKAKVQREKWASEIKKRALNAYNICEKNNRTIGSLVSTTYKVNSQMNEIMCELIKGAELQGKVDSLAKELSKEDGALS